MPPELNDFFNNPHPKLANLVILAILWMGNLFGAIGSHVPQIQGTVLLMTGSWTAYLFMKEGYNLWKSIKKKDDK